MKDSLSELDDITVSTAFAPSTQFFGRSIAPHEKVCLAMLNSVDDTDKQQFWERFAALLSNQPQLFGSVLFRARKNVVGADERAARLTFEHSFRRPSLNSFGIRSCGNDPNGCARRVLDAEDLVNDPGDRFAVSAEYRQSNRFAVALPDHTVNFRASNARSLVYSLSYGRNRMMVKNGRLDLAVNYEDTTVSEVIDLTPAGAVIAPAAGTAKAVRDRFVASATYTYKISNMMSMPVSLIYANHASYLGDVGRKLNAHFGITLKMPNGQ